MKKTNNTGKQKLKFALPKGSLNDSSRGDTEALLKEAGFDIRGYKPSSRSYTPRIANDAEIDCIVDRPQNMPLELRDCRIDLGIMGSDIALEWQLAGIELKKVSDLNYGGANLVLAVSSSEESRDMNSFLWNAEIIRCATEYPLITQQALADNPTYRQRFGKSKPTIVSKFGRFGNNESVIISESYGATESAILREAANCIAETTSTGSTLRENGLVQLGILLSSEAGLYTSRTAMADPWKADKIGFINDMLQGAVKARKTDYLVFNVRREQEDQMIGYIMEQGLSAKEPTVTYNMEYATMSIEVPKSKVPETLYGLRQNGAQDIIRMQPQQIIE